MKLQLSVLASIAMTALLNTTVFSEPRMPTAAEINAQESGGQVMPSAESNSSDFRGGPTAEAINRQETAPPPIYSNQMPSGMVNVQLGANHARISKHDANGNTTSALNLDPGLFAGFSAYYVRPVIGIGASVLYLRNTTTNNPDNKRAVTNQTFLLTNFRHDFKIKAFAPYVMIGIGCDFVSSDTVGSTHTADGGILGSFAVQLGTGLNYFITPNFSLGAGYSYTKVARLHKFGLIQNNSVLANLTAHFNAG